MSLYAPVGAEMWVGQEDFEITVTVDGKLFDREIAPLQNKVTIKRKEPAKGGEPGSTKKSMKTNASKQ